MYDEDICIGICNEFHGIYLLTKVTYIHCLISIAQISSLSDTMYMHLEP